VENSFFDIAELPGVSDICVFCVIVYVKLGGIRLGLGILQATSEVNRDCEV